MSEIAIEPTSVAEWQTLVRAAGASCDATLEESVEAYVVFMLMRFMDNAALGRQALALQWLEGMQAADSRAGGQRLRDTGDECLLICGLFPQRVRRRALPFSYYVDLGRGAYDTLARVGRDDAAPWGALARGFVRLMEVLQAMRFGDSEAALELDDAAALARQTGSRQAWDRAAPANVTLLDTGLPRRD